MRISACVVIKNEEKNIRRWLVNMRHIADEIIVVDTGSTDATLKILKEAGIKVYHFAWCNDFAAAKNYAIKQATGDWVVFLDADEYFDEKSLLCFRGEMARYNRNKRIGAVMCQLVNIDADNKNRVIGTMIQVRVFRNKHEIYYKNSVHEQLVTAPGKYIMQKSFSLRILHTGYSTSIVQKKAERNLIILKQREKQAKTQQDREQLYVFFMDAYNCLGIFDKVLEYAQKVVKADMQILGGEIHVYECMISAMSHLGKDDKEILDVIELAREKFPQEVFFAGQLGYYFYVRQDFIQSERYVLEALRLRKVAEKALKAGNLVTDTSLRIMPVVYGVLANICLYKGRKDLALENALKGIEFYKYNNILVQALYKSLKEKPVVEILQIFDCIYDRKQDGDFLLDTLGWQVSKEFAAYYNQTRDSIASMKLYLKTENYKGAVAVGGEYLDLLNHTVLADAMIEKDDDKEQITSMFAIMPDKYKKMLAKPARCRSDVDGRAAMRIIEGIKYSKSFE